MKFHKTLSLLSTGFALLSQAAMADATITLGQPVRGLVPACDPSAIQVYALDNPTLQSVLSFSAPLPPDAAAGYAVELSFAGNVVRTYYGSRTSAFVAEPIDKITVKCVGGTSANALPPFNLSVSPVDIANTDTLTASVTTALPAWVAVFDGTGNPVATQYITASGDVPFELPLGKYKVRVSTTETDVWGGQSPIEKAKTYTLKGAGAKATVSIGQKPTLQNVARFGSNGATLQTTNIGLKRGCVDFGGYISCSSTDIPNWNTSGNGSEITVKIPAKAGAGCYRVFSKTGGWSAECLMPQ